jgi:hypothetical protein
MDIVIYMVPSCSHWNAALCIMIGWQKDKHVMMLWKRIGIQEMNKNWLKSG